MRKWRVGVAVTCMVSMILGMTAYAEVIDGEKKSSLGEDSFLMLGTVRVIEKGEVISTDLPQGVHYDEKTNTLTLTNCRWTSADVGDDGIHCRGMGEDFSIKLEGDNTINIGGNSTTGIFGEYLTLEGPGKLTINCANDPTYGGGYGFNNGIVYEKKLIVKDCTINIFNQSNVSQGGEFYGISMYPSPELGEALIENANINVQSTVSAGVNDFYNVGIDAQYGNLSVKNSNINVDIRNGRCFGIGAGLIDESGVIGGTFTLQNSTIKCSTKTDGYATNMYFYKMNDLSNSYYYVGDDSADNQASFEEVFEVQDDYKGRYRGRYNNLIISPKPLTELCKHQWDEGKVVKEVTCTEGGEVEYTCTICKETKTEQVGALGHDSGEWTMTKAATCTEDGSKDLICKRCGETQKTEVINAIGHQYTWTVEKEATFNEVGLKKGVCQNCGEEITAEIPKLSESHVHDFTGKEEVLKEPTCTEEGSKAIYCKEVECGEHEMQVMPAFGHKEGEWMIAKEATCAEKGLEKKTCSVCNIELETRVIERKEHTFGEWEEVTSATCTEIGTETMTCMVCGEVVTREIPVLGHDFSNWTANKAATCTKPGEETSTCSRCDAIDTRVIEPMGHSLGAWKVTKEPTIAEKGEKESVCIICKEVIKTEIPKLIPADEPQQGDKPLGGGNNGNAGKTPTVTIAEKGVAPKTADTTNVGILLMVSALSMSVIGFIVFRKRKIG